MCPNWRSAGCAGPAGARTWKSDFPWKSTSSTLSDSPWPGHMELTSVNQPPLARPMPPAVVPGVAAMLAVGLRARAEKEMDANRKAAIIAAHCAGARFTPMPPLPPAESVSILPTPTPPRKAGDCELLSTAGAGWKQRPRAINPWRRTPPIKRCGASCRVIGARGISKVGHPA